MLQRDMSRFSVENFLSHSVEKYRRATPQGVTNFEYRKRLCFRGYVTKFCRNFLSHSTETFRRGTRNPSVLFFRKFVVAKKFTVKKAGEYQNFPSNFFCLKVPKIFVGEPFILPLISRIEKFYASKGYVKIFCRNFFVSQYRNISLRNPSVLCFRKVLVAKKFMYKKR